MKRCFCWLIIVVLLFPLVACNQQSKPEPYQPLAREAVQTEIPDEIQKWIAKGDLDEDIKDILTSSVSLELPVSPADLIEAAFVDGQIDRKTKALLMITAAFTPQSLAAEYAGMFLADGRDWFAGDLQWLINYQDQLSDEELIAVRPYLLSPDDPESYFHPDYTDQKRTLAHQFSPTDVYASEIAWESYLIEITGASKEIALHYQMKGLTDAQQSEIDQKIQWIDQAIQKAWPMFQQLLGTQPGYEIDIYLTPNLPKSTTGFANYFQTDGNITRYRILLREGLLEDTLKSVAVHELFHLFQFEMGLTWYMINSELDWLTEATAVWSEHFVYPEFNREHVFLPEFAVSLSEDRLSTRGEQEYGSYMLFYLMTEIMNKPTIVADVLKAVSGLSEGVSPYSLAYVNIRGTIKSEINSKVGNINDVFGRFAVGNWNSKPYLLYSDVDKKLNLITLPFSPAGGSMTYVRYANANYPSDYDYSEFRGATMITIKKGNYQENVSLPAGAIHYIFYLFSVPPEEIEKVVFDFTDDALEIPAPPGGNEMVSVMRQAFIKIGDEWLSQVEDWTHLDTRVFCRKNPQENVTALVLAYSYSDIEAKNNSVQTYMVDTRGQCADYKGFIEMTWNLPQLIESEKVTTFDEATFSSKDELIYCADSESYVAVQRNVNYYLYSFYKNIYLADSGDYLGANETVTEENGRFSGEFEVEHAPVILEVSADRKSISLRDIMEVDDENWIETSRINVKDSFGEITKDIKTSLSSSPNCSFGAIWSEPFTSGSKTYQFGDLKVADICTITDAVITGTRTVTSELGETTTLHFSFTAVSAASDDNAK